MARADMPTARSNLSVEVVNGILYAIGGHDGSNPVATVEAYDPSTNTWTTRDSLPTAARAGLEVVTSNGRLYAVGGWTGTNTPVGTLDVYTPAVTLGDINLDGQDPNLGSQISEQQCLIFANAVFTTSPRGKMFRN